MSRPTHWCHGVSVSGPVDPSGCCADQRHPEDYCHRCDGPNISWFTPGAAWDSVMRADGMWKWQEIICPTCFVELAGGGTWHLIPAKADGERWTGADERAQIIADARSADQPPTHTSIAAGLRAEVDRAASDRLAKGLRGGRS